MKALIVSLESFQRGEIPEEVKKYILSQHGNIFTILDESSKIKTNEPCKDSKKSKRTQAILRLANIGERCILTGTFTSKSPVNAYDQMNFLKDGFFSESMYAFAEHYVIRRSLPSVRGARITLPEKDYMIIRKRLLKAKNDKYALTGVIDSVRSFYGITPADCMHILKHEEYTPFKNLDEMWARIGDTCMKVDRKTVKLPVTKTYRTYKVSLTKEQEKLYLQLQNQFCTDHITVDNGLKLYIRFQDVCNGYEPVDHGDTFDENGNVKHNIELVPLSVNPKLDMLEEIIDDIGNKQVVIWCSRTKLLYDAEKRMRELGYTTAIYDGKINKEEREEGYKAFSEGKIQLILANPRSAGYGLDGLRNCDYAIYLCNSYSVEERLQSENRIHRGIVTCPKYIIDIQCEGTCEARVVEALKLGKELIDTGTIDSSIFMYDKE